MSQRFLIIAIVVVAGLLGVALVTFLLLGGNWADEPVTITPAVTATPSPAPNTAETLTDLRQAAATANATGEPVEANLVITEEEANAQAAPVLMEMELPEDLPVELERVYIDFQPDAVLTELVANAYGISVTAEVMAEVNVVDGQPEIEVTEINFGWVPLPEAVKEQLAELITSRVADFQADVIEQEIAAVVGEVDWSITYLSIQADRATVTLLLQPGATAD